MKVLVFFVLAFVLVCTNPVWYQDTSQHPLYHPHVLANLAMNCTHDFTLRVENAANLVEVRIHHVDSFTLLAVDFRVEIREYLRANAMHLSRFRHRRPTHLRRHRPLYNRRASTTFWRKPITASKGLYLLLYPTTQQVLLFLRDILQVVA